MGYKKMNLEQWSLIAEIVAAIAVLVTLWFLILEMRRNRQQAKRESQEGITQLRVDMLKPLYDDAEVSSLIWKGLFINERIDTVEWGRFALYLYSLFVMIEIMWQHTTYGEFDTERYNQSNIPLRWWLEKPGVQRWWATRPDGFSPAFCQHVEDELAALKQESRTGHKADEQATREQSND